MTLKTRYQLLFLGFVVLGIYYPSIFADVNSIDDLMMMESLINSGEMDIWHIFFTKIGTLYYRPFILLTFYADRYLWGLEPSFIHLENVFVHMFNSILVYCLASVFLKKVDFKPSFIPFASALLFAVHPINSESVNWISGRTDLLSATFMFGSILVLLNSLNNWSVWKGALSAFLLFMSLLCKETPLFVLPVIFYLIYFCEFNLKEPYLKPASLVKNIYSGLYVLSVVCYLALRHLSIGGKTLLKADSGISAAVSGPAGYTFYDNIRISLKILGFYLKKLFVPWPLNFYITTISDYYVVLGIFLFIVFVYLLYRRDLLSFLALIGILTIVPAIFVALGRMAMAPLAERYLYIPAAAFSIVSPCALYMATDKLPNNVKISLLIPAVVLLFLFACSTTKRSIVWQGNVTLFSDTLKKSPNAGLIKNELANALLYQGKVDDAKKLFKENAADNHSGLAILNQAKALIDDVDFDAARQLLTNSLDKSGGRYVRYLQELLQIQHKQLKKNTSDEKRQEILVEMLGYYEKLFSATGDPLYYYKMGQVNLSLGKDEKARTMFEKAYMASPEDSSYKAAAQKLVLKLPLPQNLWVEDDKN